MEKQLLQYLNDKNEIEDSLLYAQENKYDHKEVVGLLKSLEADGSAILLQKEKKIWDLTADGAEYAEKGISTIFNYFKVIIYLRNT